MLLSCTASHLDFQPVTDATLLFVAIVRLRSEDVTVKEPKQFAIRWRIAGTANVPFPGLKIKPYIVPRFSAVSQTQEKR